MTNELKIKNLYRSARHKSTDDNEINEKHPVGREKAPSWEKICFQLGNYFFITGNLVLGGYSLFNAFVPFFMSKYTNITEKEGVKRFDKRLPFL